MRSKPPQDPELEWLNGIENKIKKLTDEQMNVLKDICEGKTQGQIAKERDRSEETIKSHCQGIYDQFEIPEGSKYRHVNTLRTYISPYLQLEVEERTRPPERRGGVWMARWTLVALAAVFLIGVVLGFITGRLTAPNRPQTPSSTPPTLLTTAQATLGTPPEITKPPIPTTTAPPSPTQPTATARVIVVTATSPPATNTPVNSPTPRPSPTPSIALPFVDTFDNGMDPRWKVVEGTPVIINGQLGSATDLVIMEIGDNSLSNYSVEFDVFGGYGGGVTNVFVDFAHSVRYLTSPAGNQWIAIQNGELTQIAVTNGFANKIRLVVNNGTYAVYSRGVLISSLVYGRPTSGPMTITIYKERTIDNLKIEPVE